MGLDFRAKCILGWKSIIFTDILPALKGRGGCRRLSAESPQVEIQTESSGPNLSRAHPEPRTLGRRRRRHTKSRGVAGGAAFGGIFLYLLNRRVELVDWM